MTRTGKRERRVSSRRYVGASPIGLGYTKPNHSVEIAKVLRENRDQLPFAWVWDDRDRLIGAARDDVLMAAEDARRLGVRPGDAVLLRSEAGEFRGRVRIADIGPGNLAAHWPEANALIRTGHYDPSCGEPDYNAVCEVIPQ